MLIHKTNMKGYVELTVVKDLSSEKDFEQCTYTIKGTELKSGIECTVVFTLEEIEQINADTQFFLDELRRVDMLVENQQDGLGVIICKK
jgi:hypothetical protein